MPSEKIVGAPSAQAQDLKTDIRDQRVKELLTLPSMDRRLQMLYGWVHTGAIDQVVFSDLIKIIMRQAELQEVAKDLRKVTKEHATVHPDNARHIVDLRALVSALPSLAAKLEVVAGLKS
jgi:hypothetical protein